MTWQDVERWLRTLPADKELVEAILEGWPTPPIQRIAKAFGRVAQAYGGEMKIDPATGLVASIGPPELPALSVGGHPSGTNRGGLMPPGM